MWYCEIHSPGISIEKDLLIFVFVSNIVWMFLHFHWPLCQHIKGTSALCPTFYHPSCVEGRQEATGTSSPHRPERLQKDAAACSQLSESYNINYTQTISRIAQLRNLLTSRRLSPTSATSTFRPNRSLTRAAFSEAHMQVKSNMATSGWPQGFVA